MNPIAELLGQLGPVRVAALAATGIAVLGFFIFLSSRLSSGGMALLYGDLDPQDSGQIIQTLQSKNVPYDINYNTPPPIVIIPFMVTISFSL